MTPQQKIALAARIWVHAMAVHVLLRTQPLPKVISLSVAKSPLLTYGTDAVRLGQIVRRVLTVFGRPPRCLIAALVAHRILRAGGYNVELVIGLPRDATDKDAHAWLELGGRDIGPPPGQSGHIELARYR